MKILAVDTTAAAASVALCEDTFLVGEFFVNLKQTHSQTLMPMIGSLLKSCGVTPTDIGLFAVSCGPGSFTGVRIGVAAVKGLALPFGTPCVAASSLEALAYNLAGSTGIICPVMDARRSQFYNAMFENDGGTVKRLTPDRAIDIKELENELCLAILDKKTVFLVGDGAKICYNMLNESVAEGVILAPQNLMFTRASSVAAAGFQQFIAGDVVTPSSLLPSYLRLPQAERELKLKNSGTF
jgi:tRNA threonylcarbamoyladenosine biosynthesis protein TsaB